MGNTHAHYNRNQHTTVSTPAPAEPQTVVPVKIVPADEPMNATKNATVVAEPVQVVPAPES